LEVPPGIGKGGTHGRATLREPRREALGRLAFAAFNWQCSGNNEFGSI
jgi:hypothetical protein